MPALNQSGEETRTPASKFLPLHSQEEEEESHEINLEEESEKERGGEFIRTKS
jgi:hypothetical protein